MPPIATDRVITTAEIRAFFRLRRRCLIIPVFAATLGAAAYMQFATPIYTAKAQIIIDPRLPQFLPGRNEETVLAWDTAQVESEIAVIQSERIGGMVVSTLTLDGAEDFRAKPSPLAKFMSLAHLAPFPGDAEVDRFREALTLMQGGLNVRRTGLSYAIDISFSFPDPLRAKDVANAVARAYILDQLESRSQYARIGGDWLQQRMVQLRAQMNSASQAAQAFRANHDYRIPRPSGSGADPSATETIDELDAAASTYRRIYETFLESYTQSVQRQSFPVSDAHILTEASLPTVKSAPKGLLIFASAELLGCMIGLGLAVLFQNFDRTIRSAGQIPSWLGIDELGTLPRLANAPLLDLKGRFRTVFWRRKTLPSGTHNRSRQRIVAGRSWKPRRWVHYFSRFWTPGTSLSIVD